MLFKSHLRMCYRNTLVTVSSNPFEKPDSIENHLVSEQPPSRQLVANSIGTFLPLHKCIDVNRSQHQTLSNSLVDPTLFDPPRLYGPPTPHLESHERPRKHVAVRAFFTSNSCAGNRWRRAQRYRCLKCRFGKGFFFFATYKHLLTIE